MPINSNTASLGVIYLFSILGFEPGAGKQCIVELHSKSLGFWVYVPQADLKPLVPS